MKCPPMRFSRRLLTLTTAWRNWWDSHTGKRAGKPSGRPRFKAKRRCRDSFRIHHDVKKPTIRPDGYRRVIVPRLGSIRVHSSTKPLCRAIARGAVIQSVTISRGGHRWYASILIKDPTPVQAATRCQRVFGRVGVDLGVTVLAALSTGETIANPRHLRVARKRLAKAQRALSRTQKGSARRRRCARILGRRLPRGRRAPRDHLAQAPVSTAPSSGAPSRCAGRSARRARPVPDRSVRPRKRPCARR
jgi:putative transposase